MKKRIILFLTLSLQIFGANNPEDNVWVYQIDDCKIQQKFIKQAQNTSLEMQISQSCTRDQLLEIVDRLESTELQNAYKETVKNYFDNLSHMPMIPTQDSNLGTYTAATWSSVSTNGSNRNFEETFGTHYDPSSVGETRYGIVSELIYGDPEREALIRSGAGLVMATYNGTLPDLLSAGGERLGAAWTAILKGPEPDRLSEAQVKAIRQYQIAQLQNYQSNLIQWSNRLRHAEQSLVVANEIQVINTTKTIEAAVQQFRSISRSLAQSQNQINLSRSSISTLTAVKAASLNLPNTEIERLRSGRLSTEQVNQLAKDLTQSFQSNTIGESLTKIQGYQQMAAEEENPFRKEQLEFLTKEFVDDRGLVTQWASTDPLNANLQLQSSPATTAGKHVRNNLNVALGYRATHSPEDNSYERAGVAINILQQSDLEYSAGNPVLGKRYLERGRVLLDYATQHPRTAYYQQFHSSERAISQFGINVQVTNFENHQLYDLSERLAVVPNLNSDENAALNFQAVTTLKAAEKYSREGKFSQFLTTIDTGYDLLDFCLGVGVGVRNVVVDTATGIVQVVSHPVDSAEAIYHAIANYDETLSLIGNKIESVIDEYPNMSPAEKGELVGEVTTEIAGLFTGIGAMRSAATTSFKIASSIARAGTELTEFVAMGAKGARRISQIAPELLDSFPYTRHNLRMGNLLANASPEFMTKMSDYLDVMKLPKQEAQWYANFKNGASRFYTEDSFTRYVQNGSDILAADEQLFVIPKAAADSITQTGNLTAENLRTALGWTDLQPGTKLVRVDLPFKFEYFPQRPIGYESGANQLFKLGGYTKGGLPELVYYQVKKSDILLATPLGPIP